MRRTEALACIVIGAAILIVIVLLLLDLTTTPWAPREVPPAIHLDG